MSYLNPNAGPDEFTQVTKEVCRVYTGTSNTVTKGELVPILPYAPDQELSKGGWRFATAVSSAKGGERIWGVALEDAGPSQYFRCQISGVCKVKVIGKLSDAATNSSVVQGTALTCNTSTNLTVSSPAYKAQADDAIICVVLFGEAGPGAGATLDTTVLLTGPYPQRKI